jgi:rRNA-processing protein FCF1
MLRGKCDILELMKEIDETSAEVIFNIKDILTSREGVYLLYDIKRFKKDVVEDKIDLISIMNQLVNRALEFEIKEFAREEIDKLSKEIDRKITKAMREGINGYFFSSLYKIHKKLKDKSYAIQFLLLSVLRLMLNTNSIRSKLKGLTG